MDHIIGQPRSVAQVQSALDTGRAHHGWVFHGPTGVGKMTTAWAFARVWLCHRAQADLTGRVVACGSCPSCRVLPPTPHLAAAKDDDGPADANHPDLSVIRKELAAFSDDAQTRRRKLMTIPVGVLSEYLLGPVTRKPALGHGRVFLVDEAERLDQTGQNRLLKTLEEPPGGVLIVLVTSALDRLLPTIRSRCQLAAFTPLSDEQVKQVLARSSKSDNEPAGLLGGADEPPELENEEALLAFACGSPGRALLAQQYGLDEWAESILRGIDRLMEGGTAPGLGSGIAERIDGFAKQWVADHDNASKEAANRQAASLMASMIADHARRRLRATAQQCDHSDVDAATASLDPWMRVIDTLGESERYLASNVNLGIVCDHLVSRVARIGMGAVESTHV